MIWVEDIPSGSTWPRKHQKSYRKVDSHKPTSLADWTGHRSRLLYLCEHSVKQKTRTEWLSRCEDLPNVGLIWVFTYWLIPNHQLMTLGFTQNKIKNKHGNDKGLGIDGSGKRPKEPLKRISNDINYQCDFDQKASKSKFTWPHLSLGKDHGAHTAATNACGWSINGLWISEHIQCVPAPIGNYGR